MQGVFIFMFLSLSLLFANAQQHSVLCNHEIKLGIDSFEILYGQSININLSNDSGVEALWKVSPAKGVNIKSGKGNTVNGLVFASPGNYKVVFTVPRSSDHKKVVKIAKVCVQDYRIEFAVDSSFFTKPLKAGGAIEEIELIVPVNLVSHNQKNIVFNPVLFQSEGDAQLSVYTSAPVLLKPGFQRIAFKIKIENDLVQGQGGFIPFSNGTGAIYYKAFIIE